MEKELRKQRDILVTTGTGICIFGLWSVLRVVMGFILDKESIMFVGEELQDSVIFNIVFFTLFILALAIALFCHLYIGFTARSVGLKGKNRTFYLIFAGVNTVILIFLIIYSIQYFNRVNFITFIISMLVDLTLLATLIRLLIAGIKVKRLTKRLGEQENV